jgi:hypothetical protein
MRKRKSNARALLSGLAIAALLSVAPARVAWSAGPAASTTKVPQLRTIEGMVSRKDGAPVQGAVVYLQDTKSLAVKSYLSDAQGQFHFRHLSMSLDYDLWAELNGKRSKTKSVSQFNSKPDLRYRLKLPIGK